MTPILLLEINEVPWRLLDRYLGRPEYPHLNRFFRDSTHFTTLAVDTGELSPWVTWPTLHRGLNNEQHGIKNLGQDPATFKGKPIWQEIRERNGSIGVCGSMQSWPPMDPGNGGFYIPDTFAHDERCHPAYLNALQAFNLAQVRKNARVVGSGLPRASDIVRIARSFRRAGVTLRTAARIASQLLRERADKSLVARRPVFQTVIFWDVFRRHFNAARPPHLSTFFTNHVAGVMHRYWKDVFPEDFPGEAQDPESSHEWVMCFALSVLDDMLREVLEWADRNPGLVVVFASSMGQAAVHRGYHEGMELVVEDLALLMHQAGLSRTEYVPLLAMAPQVAVEVRDERLRMSAAEILQAAACNGGRRHFIRVQVIGSSLSITIETPPLKDMTEDGFQIGGRQVKWADAGIRKQEVEPGTGYHIPEGSLAVLCRSAEGIARAQARPMIRADRLKDWLLDVSNHGPARISSLATDFV